MANVLTNLAIQLLLDVTELQKGLNVAMKQSRKFGREMTAVGKDLTMKVTAPLAGVGLASLKVAGDFEASMNRVGAITGETGDRLTALRDKAKELGAATQFSATEASAGIEMLAKNGLKYEQIMGGALDSTLALSAATGSELSRAADIGTDAMLAFGIEASKMAAAVDSVTGVTLNSKFDIEQYALALARGGSVASSVGVSFDEFNASIAAIAPAFSSGQTAGTAFSTFLTRLVPQSEKAESAMKQLGLEFFDANGQMKDLAGIAGQLQTAFEGLSEAERIELATDMFGTQGMQAAFALAKAGTAEIERLNAAIKDTSANAQAEARLKGLNGALTKMRSALEAVGIAIADSGLLDKATRLIEKATAIFSSLSKTNPALLQTAVVLGGVAAAAGPLIVVLGQLAMGVSAILAVIGGKAGLVAGMGMLVNPIGLTIAAIGALTLGYITFKDEIDAFLAGTWRKMVEGWNALPEIIEAAGIVLSDWVSIQKNQLAGVLDNWSRTGKRIGLVVEQMIVGIEGWLIDRFQAIANKANKITESISEKFRWLKDKVVGNSWVPDMVDGIGAEAKRLELVWRDPIFKQNEAISENYKKLAADVSSIDLSPEMEGPPIADAKPTTKSVTSNPFIFGVSQSDVRKSTASIDKAAKKISKTGEAPFFETIKKVESDFTRLGDSVADSIFNLGDTLKGGETDFKSFGRAFEDVFGTITKGLKGLDGQSVNVSGGIFNGLAGTSGGGSLQDTIGLIGNVLNPGAGGASAGGGDIVSGVLSGIGSIFGGFFADGGVAPANKLSVVGEKGPEIIAPRHNTSVVPVSKISQTTTDQGQVINITVNQHNSFEGGGNQADLRKELNARDKRLLAMIPDAVQRAGGFRRAMQR